MKRNELPNGMQADGFDLPGGRHVFSEHYVCRKQALLARLGRRAPRRRALRTAAVAAACALVPFTACAVASHADFFRNAFGADARPSVAAHEETFYEPEKGSSYTVTFPAHEYVDVDVDRAEALIGGFVADEPIEIPVNDHTLTILSAVRDRNAMVLYFTLSCDTGVTALAWDDWSNESKGAYLSDESTFYFRIDGASDCVYVDPIHSTDTCLYCFDHVLFDAPLGPDDAPTLVIDAYDAPYLAMEEPPEPRAQAVDIPVPAALPETVLRSGTGGRLELSPIGLWVNSDETLNLGYLRTVTLRYRDGSEYAVLDDPGDICNAGYVCGREDDSVTLTFNRLVDPDAVAAVTVNGVEYAAG